MSILRLSKIAARLTTELQPHQERVVQRMKDQPGLVVAHGLGSGKTLTSIAAQEALGLPASVVVPAALQENYMKEVAKHTAGKPAVRNMVTMQRVARGGTPLEDPMLIIDEAHRARDPESKTLDELRKNTAQKRMLLSASPFYNHPADIAPLINLASGEKLLPENKSEFEKKYVEETKVSPGIFRRLTGISSGVVKNLNPKSKKELESLFKGWVDYHRNAEGFPSVEREDVKVPMSSEQLEVYNTLMGTAPAWVKYKVERGFPPNKTESKNLNAYLSAVRQASNTTAPFQTKGDPQQTKIDAAVVKLKEELASNPRSKAVVYSNFLDAGVKPYVAQLDQAGVPYGMFTGDMKEKDRIKAVKDYNSGKVRALVVSSAGGEGLDLQGTRLIQVLEPHWNTEKLKQVEGRGVRFGSHTHLPPEEQKVRVQRFLAVKSPKGILERTGLKKPGGSSDEFMARLSDDKEKLINQFSDILKEQEP